MRQVVFPEALRDAVRATGFSPAVRAGDFLYFTGATGGHADGSMPESVAEQAEVALGKVLEVLRSVGAEASAIVEMTSYHSDIRHDFDAVQTVVEELLGNPLPAWTAVEVTRLRRDGARVEFRIVAHHPVSGGEAA